MSYLLDKKIKKKKIFFAVFGVIICVILFYFRTGIFNGLSLVSHTIFQPVLVIGNAISGKMSNVLSFFSSKSSLYLENQNLKLELSANRAERTNYDSILAENASLKEILGRKDEAASLILSAILSKPNQSPYDTLVIDAGIKQGLQTGDMVFALGNVPIGRVADVYSNSSKVILFTNAGEKTQVVVPARNASSIADAGGGEKNVFMEVTGRGGGNFEMIVPRDFTLLKGDTVTLPGIFPYVLAKVETIISDPRDPFIKALLASPVNIQELKFVEVETHK